MNLGQFYDLANFITRKERSGKISTAEFNMILPVAMYEFYAKMVGLPEVYVPGRPVPAVAPEITETVRETFRKFFVQLDGVSNPLLMVDNQGKSQMPSDYCHYPSARYKYKKGTISLYRPIDILMDYELSDRLSSSIEYPSHKNPVCCLYGDHIQFYPIDIHYVTFTYLRWPAKPYMNTTINVYDQEVYSSTGSVELEFSEIDQIKIMSFYLEKIGINLKDGLISQYANQKKMQGT